MVQMNRINDRQAHNPKVAGSSPAPAIKKCTISGVGLITHRPLVLLLIPLYFKDRNSQAMLLLSRKDFDSQKLQSPKGFVLKSILSKRIISATFNIYIKGIS